MTFKLENRVAIVTGGGRGIGKGIALRLAAEGCSIVIAQRDPTSAAATVGEIEEIGGRALFVPTDVAQSADIVKMVEKCESFFGRVDVMVNNAGLSGLDENTLDMTLETWNRSIATNLTSIFVGVQASARAMVRGGRGGSIINIASINSFRAQKLALHYVATKGAIPLLTMGMAVDLSEFGIRVNAIAPGLIKTERTSPRYLESAAREMVVRNVPLGRTGTVEEVGALAVFLASDDSSYIQGETILIDGGFTGYLRFD